MIPSIKPTILLPAMKTSIGTPIASSGKSFLLRLGLSIAPLLLCLLSCHRCYPSSLASSGTIAEEGSTMKRRTPPGALSVFMLAYPEVRFTARYDEEQNDWLIIVTSRGLSTPLYWAEGKFLPKEYVALKDEYSSILYKYPSEPIDPATLTSAARERILEYSSKSSRTTHKGTPTFLQDAIFDTATKARAESNIVSYKFLGRRLTTHKGIKEAVLRVEAALMEARKTSSEVDGFITNLYSVACYSWRNISDSGSRSFHSMALAIDLLPKGYKSKNIYWAWRREIAGDKWVDLPLERRWMPPKKVIDIFESEGFIWGGKWTIWDNMHFEYKPELLVMSLPNLTPPPMQIAPYESAPITGQ